MRCQFDVANVWSRKNVNPTHGSGWIVQIRPTTGAGPDYVVIFLFLASARKRIKTGSHAVSLRAGWT